MQRLVDNAVGIAKESVKTMTREAFNNAINLVNGIAAMLLVLVPESAKARLMESLHGWEMRPTFRAPVLPAWMQDGVSSLNDLIYDLCDSDSDSESDGESCASDYGTVDDLSLPSSPSSSSRHSRSSVGGSSYRGRRFRPFSLLRRLAWWAMWPVTMWIPRRPRQHRRAGGGGSSGADGAAAYRRQEDPTAAADEPPAGSRLGDDVERAWRRAAAAPAQPDGAAGGWQSRQQQRQQQQEAPPRAYVLASP